MLKVAHNSYEDNMTGYVVVILVLCHVESFLMSQTYIHLPILFYIFIRMICISNSSTYISHLLSGFKTNSKLSNYRKVQDNNNYFLRYV